MKLQKKTTLVLIPLSVVMCIFGFVCVIIFINPVFADWAFKNTNLAIDILEYDSMLLSTVVKDYAEWTEMYEFVELESEDFTGSNIDLVSLGYDIGFIVNSNRKIIYCETRNEVGEIIKNADCMGKINTNFENFTNEYADGFIEFNDVYYMFATSPITDTTRSLPINGYMFLGKKFDEENNIVLWNEFFDLEIELLNTPKRKIEENSIGNYSEIPNGYKDIYYSIDQINKSKIKSSIKLLDIEGDHFANVEIITHTDFLSEGCIGIMYYYLVMIVSFIAFMFTIIKYLIKSDVLEPINKIIKKIDKSDIYHNGDFLHAIDIGNKNELCQLENVVDNYILSIKNHNDKILEINYSLEEKVNNRTKELSELNKKLETQAYYDSLTGIANRTFFYDNINRVFNRVKRNSKNAALIYMDLDGFKAVNDTYGHDVGDEVLIQFSNRIKERIRLNDFFARMGGDEFTIIVEDVESDHEITSIIDTIVEIACKDIVVGEIVMKIGVSAGYAIIDNSKKSIDEVIKLADKEMYKKKQERKC